MYGKLYKINSNLLPDSLNEDSRLKVRPKRDINKTFMEPSIGMKQTLTISPVLGTNDQMGETVISCDGLGRTSMFYSR